VPASVVKKLITINPSLLHERRMGVFNPAGGKRHGLSVLQVYLDAPTWVIDSWKINFEICKLLIEAEPKLLFYHDKDNESGKDTLLEVFDEEAKAYLKSLEKRFDLKALEREAPAEQKEWFQSLGSGELADY